VAKSPAWTRKEGQNPNGGLNAKGRASAKKEGHNLKPPVRKRLQSLRSLLHVVSLTVHVLLDRQRCFLRQLKIQTVV
jgi:hypothetical protein